jgi:Transcriptional regulator/sugar kinase
MLTLGTGVGGGVVVNDTLFRAWTELGHMVIVADGVPCDGACAGRGHVEAYCSGTAANRIAREVLGPDGTARDLSSSTIRRSS